MLTRRVALLALCVCLGAAAGCLETKHTYTVNPNGSGKVLVEATLLPSNILGGRSDPDARVKNTVSDILTKSRGVAAWKDVEYKRLKDGRLWFRGTAYFGKLSEVQLAHVQIHACKWTREHADRFKLDVADVSNKDGKEPKPRRLSKEEMKKETAKQRAAYQEMKEIRRTMFSAVKVTLSFHLPGTAQTKTNLRQGEDKALHVTVDAQGIGRAMDELVLDDAWMRKQILAGYDISGHIPLEDPALRKKVFGKPGPIEAVVTDAVKPLFNYGAEVAEAKQGYETMIDKLGLKKTLPVPAKGGFKAFRLVGTRFVTQHEPKDRLFPFGTRRGCVLAFIGEFPGSFVEITGGVVKKALTDDGKNVLPAQASRRKILYPYLLSKARTKVLLYVRIEMPAPGARGLRELSGTLEYTAGSTSKEVDLGLQKINVGARGKVLGAEITAIGLTRHIMGGKEEAVSIRVNLPAYRVKGLGAYDATGKPAFLLYNTTGPRTGKTASFHVLKSSLPRGGKLVVHVWQDIRKHVAPFKVTEVSWQGETVRE